MSREPEGQLRISVSQVSTLAASFADDVEAYSSAGLDGIGVWELKLGDGPDDDSVALLRESGLGSATAVPAVPSINPLPLLPGPDDPRERTDAILRSLHRLAAFGPAAVLCFTGPGDRATALRGLREVVAEAERLQLRIALEPFQAEGIESWSSLNTLGDAAAVVEEIGSPALGIQFDVWHLWNTPDLFDEIERHADLIAGVHVNDWRAPTRGWADRVLPGDGVAGVPAILGALERAGWDGFYDIEVFSDNGTFGSAYPDSLWDVDGRELVERGRKQLLECWVERRVAA
ncbi:MAG TPA: sugar phosphate isomerase/epimerase family protein [Gaiellaceae bacterium]